jgi:hypothetical protein
MIAYAIQPMVIIKGYEFTQPIVRNSYTRRAEQFKNKIITSLKVFGITRDDIEIPIERMAIKRAGASVTWYMWDERLYYSYNGCAKFVENLAMILKVIDHSINLLVEGEISKEKFVRMFFEDKNIDKQRKNAREVLGVDEDSIDVRTMTRNYKKLSKEHHPDMPGGNMEEFQKINNAHKILMSELC